MEISSRLARSEQSEQTKDFRDTAVGMVSTRSFPAIVGTADMMLKSSGVSLIGFEKIGGGHCTAIVRGGISDVRLAVESGVQTAEQFGQLVSSIIIPRPMPNLELIFPMGSRLMELFDKNGYSRLSNQAIGLLETRGFPALVGPPMPCLSQPMFIYLLMKRLVMVCVLRLFGVLLPMWRSL